MKKHIIALFLIALITSGCRSSVVEAPANNQVGILFTVAQPSHVIITITNSFNTFVKTAWDEDMPVGTFLVLMNNSDLHAGNYYATIECKGTNSDFYSKSTQGILIVR
jgi:hypothetical protein